MDARLRGHDLAEGVNLFNGPLVSGVTPAFAGMTPWFFVAVLQIILRFLQRLSRYFAIVKGQNIVADNLAFFVAFSGDHQHVARA